MRLYKTLLEQNIDDLDANDLIERLAKVDRLLALTQDRTQRRTLTMMKSRLQERIANFVPYTDPNWGIKPQNIDHLVELLRNVAPEDEKSIQLANSIVEFRDEHGEAFVARQLLELVQDLDTNTDFANFNNYDYSDLTNYLEAIIRNDDLIAEDPWIPQAANDFLTGFSATTAFGMISHPDWDLVVSGFKQIRTAEEFKLVNDFFSGELDPEGRDIPELAASASHRRPASGFDYFYKYMVQLGISHTLPSYWYYNSPAFGTLPQEGETNWQTGYTGLPEAEDLEQLGYTLGDREISFEGNSGMSIDRDGKLLYGGQTTAESIEESIQEEFNELTYHGNDFFEDFGTMWFNEDEDLDEAEYQGRKVKLGKPMQGDVKKFKVYVRNPKGNVVKVNFGDPNMRIRKSDPDARRSFRARHNCDNPGPRHKARYWSCRKW